MYTVQQMTDQIAVGEYSYWPKEVWIYYQKNPERIAQTWEEWRGKYMK